jgi:hypothetical protein
MATRAAVGYITSKGDYRGTAIWADGAPDEVEVGIKPMLNRMGTDRIIQWIENGIEGGGYDGVWNLETKADRGDTDKPLVVDARNMFQFNYTFVVDGHTLMLMDDPAESEG